MIVRIAAEGQYEIASTTLDRINAIDDRLVEAIANNDEGEFGRLVAAMADIVRQEGRPVPPDSIVESEIILPSTETSLEDARRLFAVDGLIP